MSDIFDKLKYKDLFDKVKLDIFDKVELSSEEKVFYSEELKKIINEEIGKEISKLPIPTLLSNLKKEIESKEEQDYSELKSRIKLTEKEFEKLKKEIFFIDSSYKEKHKELRKEFYNSRIHEFGNLSLPIIPSQVGNAGKFLKTDGTSLSWASGGGGGGMTIGDPVVGGTPTEFLYIDDSGNLSSDNLITYNSGSNQLDIGYDLVTPCVINIGGDILIVGDAASNSRVYFDEAHARYNAYIGFYNVGHARPDAYKIRLTGINDSQQLELDMTNDDITLYNSLMFCFEGNSRGGIKYILPAEDSTYSSFKITSYHNNVEKDIIKFTNTTTSYSLDFAQPIPGTGDMSTNFANFIIKRSLGAATVYTTLSQAATIAPSDANFYLTGPKVLSTGYGCGDIIIRSTDNNGGTYYSTKITGTTYNLTYPTLKIETSESGSTDNKYNSIGFYFNANGSTTPSKYGSFYFKKPSYNIHTSDFGFNNLYAGAEETPIYYTGSTRTTAFTGKATITDSSGTDGALSVYGLSDGGYGTRSIFNVYHYTSGHKVISLADGNDFVTYGSMNFYGYADASYDQYSFGDLTWFNLSGEAMGNSDLRIGGLRIYRDGAANYGSFEIFVRDGLNFRTALKIYHNSIAQFQTQVGIGTSSGNVGGLLHIEGSATGYGKNDGNARFLLNVDSNYNPTLELHTGKNGYNKGFAAIIDFAVEDDTDYDARIIKYDSTQGSVAGWFSIFNDGPVYFNSYSGATLFISAGGKVAIAGNQPTAYLLLPAGTITAETSPLKFTSGILMTSPEVGSMEFTSDNLYFTISTGTARKEIAFVDNTTKYFGDPSTDGSWRITVSGSNLSVQRRESSVWEEKGVFEP